MTDVNDIITTTEELDAIAERAERSPVLSSPYPSLRTDIPRLIATIRALWGYAGHKSWCEITIHPSLDHEVICDCGWSEMFEEVTDGEAGDA